MAPVRVTNSKGITIAALIVAANFAIVMQLTGVSYGRFEWTAFAAAYDTPTATATATATSTATATATATPTPLPNGAGCIADMQCASTFCSNGFCCNERCDGPGEYCNLAGDQGTCLVPAAPAPAMSDGALAAAGGLLIAIAWLALRVRRRRDRAAY